MTNDTKECREALEKWAHKERYDIEHIGIERYWCATAGFKGGFQAGREYEAARATPAQLDKVEVLERVAGEVYESDNPGYQWKNTLANYRYDPGEQWNYNNYIRKAKAALSALPPHRDDSGLVGMKENVAEQLAEQAGYWYSCSGCYESGEYGGNEEAYPYSDTFKCRPGSGCHECGGIGVRWDNTDYSDWGMEGEGEAARAKEGA